MVKRNIFKKSEDLKEPHSKLFIQLNEWLIYFNLPIQNTITKAKKLLEKEVFASVIDVKEKIITIVNLEKKFNQIFK